MIPIPLHSSQAGNRARAASAGLPQRLSPCRRPPPQSASRRQNPEKALLQLLPYLLIICCNKISMPHLIVNTAFTPVRMQDKLSTHAHRIRDLFLIILSVPYSQLSQRSYETLCYSLFRISRFICLRSLASCLPCLLINK